MCLDKVSIHSLYHIPCTDVPNHLQMIVGQSNNDLHSVIPYQHYNIPSRTPVTPTTSSQGVFHPQTGTHPNHFTRPAKHSSSSASPPTKATCSSLLGLHRSAPRRWRCRPPWRRFRRFVRSALSDPGSSLGKCSAGVEWFGGVSGLVGRDL